MNFGDSIQLLLIALIVIGPLLMALVFSIRRRMAVKEAEEAKAAARETEERLAPLRRYLAIEDVEREIAQFKERAEQSIAQSMQDAESEVSELRSDADRYATHMRQSADEYASGVRARSESEAVSIRDSAKQQAGETREKAAAARERAESLLAEAVDESQRLVAAARNQAEEIAGSAFKAKENAELYERTAKAMKNVIKGYGDEYLVPNHSVLDGLADEFGHKEAGQELKRVRKRVKETIKNQMAANCDYAEPNRRATAIEFVLDAFNGKVDTVLSKVKHDNYGKLEQEIYDAANLVNFNGQAFRNARIEPDYLNTRLEELKWAVVLKELKLEDQAEQRRIKEMMREEERARREYEKAIKQAEKEEKLLQKAMTEARKQLEAAGAEQRAEYERKLAELQGQLEAAEEKNQRALSMAQQTRRGHVYVISNVGSFGEHIYKIGMTRRLEPMDRVKELGDASVPFGFDVHALIHHEDAPALEASLHQRFGERRVNKVNPRKEFFQTKLHDIREMIEGLGIEVHWTMRAEAEEYRESISIGLRDSTAPVGVEDAMPMEA